MAKLRALDFQAERKRRGARGLLGDLGPTSKACAGSACVAFRVFAHSSRQELAETVEIEGIPQQNYWPDQNRLRENQRACEDDRACFFFGAQLHSTFERRLSDAQATFERRLRDAERCQSNAPATFERCLSVA